MNCLPRSVRRKKSTFILLFCLLALLFYIGQNLGIINFLNILGFQQENSERFIRFEAYRKTEPFRTGPGEKGQPVYLEGEEKKLADSLIEKEAFNRIASDKISLERSLKDVRDRRCVDVQYPKVLPKASVIIIFHNEAWSPLLRTAHSVVNRSPPQFLHEVVLLDDFSDKDFLKTDLEDYIAKTWPDGIVRLVRTKERSGLIRAKIAGAKAAEGEVLIFLDSHCEANAGWLEPLLSRIHEDRTAVLCPEIDLIDKDTLQYSGTGSFNVGGFWWSLHFSWRPIPQQERMRRKSTIDPIRIEPLLSRVAEDRKSVLCPIIDAIDDHTLEYSGNGGYQIGGFSWSLHFTWQDGSPRPPHSSRYILPIRSPTMAGGLFAVDRKFFFEIGAYDPGMDVWGGENLELSFRTWMCGGKLEFIPCSRVGHIFRSSHPYTFPGNKDTHGINSMRLAEVWMDDYKRLFYTHRKDLLSQDFGDISDRKLLRENLQCKSFKWYLDNVYPEKFIPDENVRAWGMIRNPASGICLDTLQKDEKTIFDMGMYHCQNGGSASQVLTISKKDQLRREEACLDASGRDGSHISVRPCTEAASMTWVHFKTNGTIMNKLTRKCLDVGKESSGGHPVVNTCNGNDSQKWTIQHYLDL